MVTNSQIVQNIYRDVVDWWSVPHTYPRSFLHGWCHRVPYGKVAISYLLESQLKDEETSLPCTSHSCPQRKPMVSSWMETPKSIILDIAKLTLWSGQRKAFRTGSETMVAEWISTPSSIHHFIGLPYVHTHTLHACTSWRCTVLGSAGQDSSDVDSGSSLETTSTSLASVFCVCNINCQWVATETWLFDSPCCYMTIC